MYYVKKFTEIKLKIYVSIHLSLTITRLNCVDQSQGSKKARISDLKRLGFRTFQFRDEALVVFDNGPRENPHHPQFFRQISFSYDQFDT